MNLVSGWGGGFQFFQFDVGFVGAFDFLDYIGQNDGSFAFNFGNAAAYDVVSIFRTPLPMPEIIGAWLGRTPK